MRYWQKISNAWGELYPFVFMLFGVIVLAIYIGSIGYGQSIIGLLFLLSGIIIAEIRRAAPSEFQIRVHKWKGDVDEEQAK